MDPRRQYMQTLVQLRDVLTTFRDSLVGRADVVEEYLIASGRVEALTWAIATLEA